MKSIARFAVVAALLFAAALPAYSASNSTCTLQNNFIVSARTPEVDLFDAPSGGQPVSTMTKADFPSCLPIRGTSPSGMLKIEISGKTYWVQPHMVVFKTSANAPVVCRKILGAADASTTTTRGLGDKCK